MCCVIKLTGNEPFYLPHVTRREKLKKEDKKMKSCKSIKPSDKSHSVKGSLDAAVMCGTAEETMCLYACVFADCHVHRLNVDRNSV